MDEQRIVLLDDEGEEHGFSIVDSFDLDDQVYVILLPDLDPEEGAVIFRVEEDEKGEDVLFEIEDDEEYERVVAFLEDDDEEDES